MKFSEIFGDLNVIFETFIVDVNNFFRTEEVFMTENKTSNIEYDATHMTINHEKNF